MTDPVSAPGDAQAETRDIVVESVLPHPPEVVWKTLTTPELIARWLMPNDFQPILGRRFTFQTRPMGDWDGVVDCQVLELEPPRRLVYSWKGGAQSNDQYGSRLDSLVTWTLVPEPGDATRLKLLHAGFRSPGNDFAYRIMGEGWGRIMDAVARIAAEAP